MLSSALVAIAVLVIQSLTLVLLTRFVPGLEVTSWSSALLAVLAIAVLNGVLWPAFIRVIQHFNLLVFMLLAVTLNGACVFVTAALLPGMQVDGLWTAFVVTLGLTATTLVFTSLFAFHDADYYSRHIIRRIVARNADRHRTDVPGIIFIQIDGLSEAVLRSALADGRVRTMARWLTSGSHCLIGWEANLPCQTSASQAGILHGSNVDIPAFRWLEKDTGRVLVSNHPRDARDIQARISDGHGLLADGGACRGNIFSGDAKDVMLTFSTVLDRSTQRSSDYAAYLSSPMNLAHTLVLVLWDIGLEIWARLRARVERIEPRGHRGFPYPLVRAFTTTFLRDIVVYSLIGDMFRGVPVAYADFVGYDEVAHHSGITRPDALAVLRRIDQQIGRLELAARSAPRPYYFVLLSDHGQTQGATFRQRYRVTLGELVQQLMQTPGTVDDINEGGDTWGYLNAFLTETSQDDAAGAARLARGAVKDHEQDDGVVQYGPAQQSHSAASVTALASGNLGLVYFNTLPGRASYEQVMAAYPGVIPGLVQHPGIGFIMVRSESRGPIAIGPRGVTVLATGHVEGEDPLAVFGPHAVEHLLRLDGFSNTPDLLLNSFYDPVADEAAAFEELIGGHGGLGGKQMHPFLMYPSQFAVDPNEEILGAEQLHRILRRWLEDVQSERYQLAVAQTAR